MHRLRLLLLAVPILLMTVVAPAKAVDWVGLPGLNAPGSSWVREYTTGLPPTTIYAATEGSGVYRSVTNGVSWQSFSDGLQGIPGAMDVRTVYLDGLTVYAGTGAGLFKSVGGSWTQVTKLNASVQALYSPIVGSMLAGVASGGVYRSADGGATWTPPAADNGMARSETVWSLGSFVGGLVYAATGSGVYRSLDNGATWTLASDGISGTILRVFADEKAPNIYYASGSDGVFRTVNAGVTWSRIDGPPGHSIGSGAVRALQQFTGVDLTRLYAGTPGGVYAGTTDHGPFPGEVRWRKITTNGLGNNTIVWALKSFVNTPGTLLAGTQSNGGYALVLQPAVNSTLPFVTDTANAPDTTPVVGQTLVANHGVWGGTATIEYEYQWQRCSSASASDCKDLANATSPSYVVTPGDFGQRFRVQVTGKNDFPTFGLNEVPSGITGTTAAAPGSLPGGVQSSTANIGPATINDNTGLPQAGMTLKAQSWLFNPAASSTSFQWLRCSSGGVNCVPIAGATQQTFLLSNTDVTKRLCVAVTGTNGFGSTTLGCSGTTNVIFPKQATQLSPTTMTGSAYVGDTLVSGVGSWEYPGTTFARQWESCNADGGSCATISNAKGAAYVVRAADLGQRLRVRISADSNDSSTFPTAVEVFTPLSAVITTPPPPAADPAPAQPPTPTPGGGGTPTPLPGNAPTQDKTAPVLQSLGAVAAKLKPGAALTLRTNLSEGGSLSVVIQRVRAGRQQGKKACKAGAKKGKKCTVMTKIATVNVAGVGGSRTVALPKRKLAAGDYRAVVTPIDAAGNRGASKTVAFKVLKK
jgi:hypothetical protein